MKQLTELTIRPVAEEDLGLVRRMFERSSPETRYLRFFSGGTNVPEHILRRLVEVDHRCREAVVGIVDGEVIGLASYDRTAEHPDSAELAVVVEDGWQRHGVGARLVREVVRLARHRRVGVVVANVLSENQRALRLVRRLSPDAHPRLDGTESSVEIPIAG
jgi:RimJ/RimL family protein N-acetyltransferase